MLLALAVSLLVTQFSPPQQPSREAAPGSGPPPDIERAELPASLPAELRDSIRFGYVNVPQDHDDPSAGALRIALVVLPARTPRPAPDPIVFIPGGPGMSVIEPWAAVAARAERIDLLREHRDFIILEPRGHGLSEPHSCAELNDTAPLSAAAPDAEAAFARRLVACRERLARAGVRLNTLNSIQAARDLEVLRRALGAPQLNLLGVSYGSRIAAEAMRTTPQTVRAAALIGPVPPDIERAADAGGIRVRLLRLLFARCRQQPACRASYPMLDAEYDSVIARAGRAPLVVRMPRSPRFPDGRLVMDGHTLAGALGSLLFQRELAVAAPLLIHTLSSYGPSAVVHLAPGLVRSVADDAESFGTFLAFRCNDFPIVHESAGAMPERCAAWIGPGYENASAEPLLSDIPALVIAGEFDARTPPEHARLAAAGLSRGHLVVAPWLGHEYGLPCINRMQRDFFAAPDRAPDATCLESLPALTFVAPVVPSRWVGAAATRARANPLSVAGPAAAALLLMLPPLLFIAVMAFRGGRGTVSAETLVLGLTAFAATALVIGSAAAIAAGARQSFLVPAIGVQERWRWILVLPWLVLVLALIAVVLPLRGRRHGLSSRTVPRASVLLGVALVLGLWVFLAVA